MSSEVRVPLEVAEPLVEGAPDVRVNLVALEPIAEGAPDVRVSLLVAEPVSEGAPQVRVCLLVLEAVIAIPDEGEMATDLFPIELGRSWTAHKIPTYATQVRTAANLRSARNSLTPFPAYDFEVSFPYLPSDAPFMSATPDPDLQRIAGFFKRMRGQGKTWLFRDPFDFRARGYAQASGDGVTTEFKFLAPILGDAEPVGQVDLLERFGFAPGDVTPASDQIAHAAHGLSAGDGPFFVASTGALPAGLSALTPYWSIADSANAVRLAASKADALAGTAVDITGVGAGAHSLTGGWAVYVDGALQLAGVSFSAPNGFAFAAAPTAGQAITADLDYLFVCQFLQDAADFEQFAGDLFELGQLQFRADPAA